MMVDPLSISTAPFIDITMRLPSAVVNKKEKKDLDAYLSPFFYGAPGKIRTCDFQLRRLTLYPLSYGRK